LTRAPIAGFRIYSAIKATIKTDFDGGVFHDTSDPNKTFANMTTPERIG